MQQDFRRSVRVGAPVGAVWDALLDVRRVASWLSIVGEVRDVDPPRRYAAVLEDRIGPFVLRADLDVTVETDPSRRMGVRAEGEDRQVASRITASVEVALRPEAEGASVEVAGRYEITGRVATLGAGAIRKKGDHVLDEFCARIAAELGAPTSG